MGPFIAGIVAAAGLMLIFGSAIYMAEYSGRKIDHIRIMQGYMTVNGQRYTLTKEK